MSSFRLIVVISMLLGAALTAPVYEEHQQVEEEHYEPAHYEFRYSVNDEHTHDIKEQHEKREGDKVEGYYSLIEPDGSKRTVHYTSDKGIGFIAHVEKSGESVHPPAPAPAPVKKLLLAPAIPVFKKVAIPVVKKIAYPAFHTAFAIPAHTYSISEHRYSAPASQEQRYSQEEQSSQEQRSSQEQQYSAPSEGSSRQGEGSTSYSSISFGSAQQHYSGRQ